MFRFSYEKGDRQSRDTVLNYHVPLPNQGGHNKFHFTEIVKAWNRLPSYIQIFGEN